MIVKAQHKGHAVTALLIGRQNARRYFAPSASAIELQLDHLSIECDLPPEFWRGRPEIRDRRLCAWLESKHHDRRLSQAPLTLAMTPAGQNCYRLARVH